MAFEPRSPGNFDLNAQISPTVIADVMARRKQQEMQMEQADREKRLSEVQAISDAVSQTVSAMVEGSKTRQKRAFVDSLANALAITPSQEGRKFVSTMVPPTQTASYDPTRADALRAAFNINPEEGTKQFLKAQFENDVAPRGSFQQARYLDDKNQVRLAKYDSRTGQYIKSEDDPIAGYAPKSGTDQFGNPIVYPAAPGRSGSQVSTPASRTQNVPMTQEQKDENAIPNLRAKAPKLADSFDVAYKEAFPQNNKELATIVNSAASSSALKAILSDPNPSQTALAGLGFHFARMSGSNSQLSDAEREIFQEPLAFLDKMKNKGYKFAKGDLSPKMKADLLRLANLLNRKEMSRGNKLILSAKRQAKGSVGSYWNDGLSKQFPTIQELVADAGEMGEQQTPNKPVSEMSTDELIGLLEQD